MMKYFQSLLLAYVFICAACTSSQDLFQPQSSEWIEVGDAQWTFDGETITGLVQDQVGFIRTAETFSNFILDLEFNPDSTINSGVFVRCNSDEINPDDCYEINIWDLHPNPDFRTGSIVKLAKPLAYVETNYQWNTYRIKCMNNRIQAWVNGVMTADLVDDSLQEGKICLQASGNGHISFRNVKIRKL